AYDKLSKELDPEKNGNHDFFIEEFEKVEEAYLILTNKKSPVLIIPETNSISKYNSSELKFINYKTVFIFSIIIIFILIAKYGNNNNSSESDTDSYNDYGVDTTAVDTSEVLSDTSLSPVAIDTTSIYYGNQLKNGASPLDACFGSGEYYGHATLTIKNGGYSDAIVCLYDVNEGKTIRNEYVQKNSNFTMSNIAEGDYKIRVLSGNDWNPLLDNACGGRGNFERDLSMYEFDGTNFFQDSDGQYSVDTVTLYGVEGGNAKSSSINQNDFFSN
ncbi:MAG: hypothetical protein RIQ59_198, partial [Bacteroidota bacterium]